MDDFSWVCTYFQSFHRGLTWNFVSGHLISSTPNGSSQLWSMTFPSGVHSRIGELPQTTKPVLAVHDLISINCHWFIFNTMCCMSGLECIRSQLNLWKISHGFFVYGKLYGTVMPWIYMFVPSSIFLTLPGFLFNAIDSVFINTKWIIQTVLSCW